MIEIYSDKAALQQHGSSAYFKAAFGDMSGLGGEIGAFLSAPLKIEQFETVD